MLIIRQAGTVTSALVLVAMVAGCSGRGAMGDMQWMVRFSAVQPAPSSFAPGEASALQIQVVVDRIASGERERAPDGTLVEFGSTGGRFESGAATQQAWTRGGVALVVLGVPAPGSYDVTARVGEAEGLLHLELSQNGTAIIR